MPVISQLYIYPVKSLGGVSVQQAQVTTRGLQHDRRWMLIDENNVFLSQRNCPAMVLFKLHLVKEGVLVNYQPTHDSITIPFQPQTTQKLQVQVWNDTCTATIVSTALSAWFSNLLSLKCCLVYMCDDSIRPVDHRYAGAGYINSFADGYPMLLISQHL